MAEWLIVLLFFTLVKGEVTTYNQLFLNFLPFTLLYLSSAFLEYINTCFKAKGKELPIVKYIIILTFIDQFSAFIVSQVFTMKKKIPLIRHWLSINPVINTKGSIAGSILGLDFGLTFYSIVIFFALVGFIQMLRFYQYKYRKSFWISCSAVLVISGGICSLLGNLTIGGSLDFLAVKNLFIADLKDIFICLGLSCLFSEFIETKKLKRILTFDLNRDLRICKELLNFSQRELSDLKQKATSSVRK
jgi:signal peptidase II